MTLILDLPFNGIVLGEYLTCDIILKGKLFTIKAETQRLINFTDACIIELTDRLRISDVITFLFQINNGLKEEEPLSLISIIENGT